MSKFYCELGHIYFVNTCGMDIAPDRSDENIVSFEQKNILRKKRIKRLIINKTTRAEMF